MDFRSRGRVRETCLDAMRRGRELIGLPLRASRLVHIHRVRHCNTTQVAPWPYTNSIGYALTVRRYVKCMDQVGIIF